LSQLQKRRMGFRSTYKKRSYSKKRKGGARKKKTGSRANSKNLTKLNTGRNSNVVHRCITDVATDAGTTPVNNTILPSDTGIAPNSGPTTVSLYVDISTMKNFLKYQSLFQDYRINRMKYTFSWVDLENDTPPVLVQCLAPTMYIRKHDAWTIGPFGTGSEGYVGNLQSIQDYLQNNKGTTTFQFSLDHNKFQFETDVCLFKPNYAYSGITGTTLGFGPGKPTWISMSTPAVQHAAVMFAVNVPVGTKIVFDIEYQVSFRGYR